MDIIALAEQMGFHCDYDDDPDADESETILLWHDLDKESDSGLLIRLQNGQADLQTLGEADVNRVGLPDFVESDVSCIRCRMIGYLEHCQSSSPIETPKPEPTSEPKPMPKTEPTPTSRRGQYWPPRTQRKEGQFKAKDSLGHYYYVEIFREISTSKSLAAHQRLVTADGESVVRIAKGQYRLVNARIDLSSDDPAAP